MTLAAMLLPLSVFLSASFLSPYLCNLSSYPRQRPTGDIKGFIVTIPLWIFFVRKDILRIQCYLTEVFPVVAEMEHQSMKRWFSQLKW